MAFSLYNDINTNKMKKNNKKVNAMKFSVVNKEPKNRRTLTKLLLSVYPGCVVYELEDAADVVSCLRDHTVDAVIWELSEKDSQSLIHLNKIRKQYQQTLFLICADDDSLLDEAMWNGASMYLMTPLLPEQLQAALGTNKKV